MNIIIGEVAAEHLRANYTVLELETFTVDDNKIKTYCVVNNISISELPTLDQHKSLHQKMIDEYNAGNYNFCRDAINHLMGKFDGELDTFYSTILVKINSKTAVLS